MRLLTRQRAEPEPERTKPARLVRMLLGVAVDAGRLGMFDDLLVRPQADCSLSVEESERVAAVRAGIAEVVGERLEELRAYSLGEFDVEADDLLEALGVPVPELERNGERTMAGINDVRAEMWIVTRSGRR